MTFVPILANSVKIFVLFVGFAGHLQAKTLNDTAQNEIVLVSRGELKEIPLSTKAQFSVGNPEIIGHKYHSKKKVLVVKGKKIGFSEILIWPAKSSDSPRRIKFFVMTKKQHMKLISLWQALQKIDLQATFSGQIIIAKGQINDWLQYQEFHRLLLKYPQVIKFTGHINPTLRNKIIGEIYEFFFKEFIDDISCKERHGVILCEYPQQTPLSKELKKYLSQKYSIRYIPITQKYRYENFRIKLKLIQIEN